MQNTINAYDNNSKKPKFEGFVYNKFIICHLQTMPKFNACQNHLVSYKRKQ